MLRMAADEDFNGRIVRGVLRQLPKLDLVRVQDIGLSGATDYEILESVARDGRLSLTHDASTIPKYAYDRVSANERMPGIAVQCGMSFVSRP